MDTTVQALEQKLAARDKTIRVLSERLEQQGSDNMSGFALFEQNIALENVVGRRTRELDEKRIELERALKELRAAQSELLHAQKLQAIGQLASGIAHEINTPTQYVGDNISFLAKSFAELTGALQSCNDLLTAGPESRSTQDCLGTIDNALKAADFDFLKEEIPRAIAESQEGIRRISTIVMAMKDFAHPSGGTRQPVDLRSLIQSTVEISRNEWKLVADLVTEFDPQLPPVDGLKDELGQVLLNLIVNAAQAIEDTHPANAAKGVIRVSAQGDGDWVEIEVADSGCGIPKELQEKIFEPFFTTKEVGRGSGQGLAIAYNVVTDKHSGKLSVRSELGKGTVFSVRLPVKCRVKEPVPVA